MLNLRCEGLMMAWMRRINNIPGTSYARLPDIASSNRFVFSMTFGFFLCQASKGAKTVANKPPGPPNANAKLGLSFPPEGLATGASAPVKPAANVWILHPWIPVDVRLIGKICLIYIIYFDLLVPVFNQNCPATGTAILGVGGVYYLSLPKEQKLGYPTGVSWARDLQKESPGAQNWAKL